MSGRRLPRQSLPRVPVTSTAFRITFGIGAGAAAAYITLQLLAAAIPAGFETADRVWTEFQQFRAAKQEAA